jgi:glycosyltransferase involved in cell wall biosynthesis
MRILFIEQFSELGGGQRNLLDLLPAVIERGWKATVAAPGEGPLFEKAREIGAYTARIGIGEYSSGRKNAKDAARFVLDTIALGRWIAHQDFDLLSVGGARLMPAAARGAIAGHGSKKVVRPVIFQAQHFLGKSYAVAMTNRAIRRTTATVIANSRHVASQFENSRVVYNGVAEIPFSNRAGSVKRIGIIGRIAPMKGQTDFLRAAAIVARELPDARFVICGAPMFTSQKYVDEVHRLAEGLPVDFLGWREDVGTVLTELDLLIAPSTAAEATTRVILEAFSAGVPVVGYAIGGIPEIVRDGENGFLVPECEPAALARKILELARMDLGEVARRARQDWGKQYTIARYQQEMCAIVANVISRQVMHVSETTSAPPQAK